MSKKKEEINREAVISVKTYKSIQHKVVYMATRQGRSISNLVERILSKEISTFEKKNGKIPLKFP